MTTHNTGSLHMCAHSCTNDLVPKKHLWKNCSANVGCLLFMQRIPDSTPDISGVGKSAAQNLGEPIPVTVENAGPDETTVSPNIRQFPMFLFYVPMFL